MAKKKIAISSKTPGRTQLINFYSFKHFRIIDLPGYGYAKVSKDKHNELMAYIDLYISSRKNIFGVFQVCDIGVVTNDDKQASQYIQKKFINHFVVLNKIDKIPKTLLKKRINEIAKFLSIDEKKIILTSTKKNLGINDIYKKIHECAKI
jgi:GTP-binding protein